MTNYNFSSKFKNANTFSVILLLSLFGILPWDLFFGLVLSGFVFKVIVAALDTPLLYIFVWLFRKKFDLEIGEEITLWTYDK